jgi:hypothetical protein
VRSSISNAGALVLVLLGAACGSDEPVRFDVEAPAGEPSAPGALPDAGSPGSALCDGRRLLERRSLAGCRFLMTDSGWSGTAFYNADCHGLPGCDALFVTNPTDRPVHIRLRFGEREEDAAPYSARMAISGLHATYSPLLDGAIGPGETAVVSALYAIPKEEDRDKSMICPTRAFIETPMPSANAPCAVSDVPTHAVELTSDAPIVVSGAEGFQLSADSAVDGRSSFSATYSLFPVHLWSNSPVETGIFKPGLPPEIHVDDEEGAFDHPTIPIRRMVLAAFDDTQVMIPQVDGSTRAVVLQRGEVTADDPNDALIGSAVRADHPVSILTYGPTSFIPWEFPHNPEPDFQRLFVQSMPQAVWGNEYVAARYGDRWEGMPEEPPWRIIGGADATVLSYSPYKPEGAPDQVARGELAVFAADAPFTVRSQDEQHPFYLSAHMDSANYQKQRFGFTGVDLNVRGGPLSVHELATSRWQKRYAFFAQPAFPEQSLVIVRRRGTADVRLDCAGIVEGWTPIDDRFELTRVALTGHLFEPVEYPGGTCNVGSHVIESDAPFAATIWAWGNAETQNELGLATRTAYALPLFGVELPAASDQR